MDIGEDIGVPEEFTKGEMVSGMWWRHLLSGGIAGAVSRTCTAPLDRIKVYLQVNSMLTDDFYRRVSFDIHPIYIALIVKIKIQYIYFKISYYNI